MANKNELPNIHSFYDRKGNLVNPSREDYLAKKSAKVGKAYAFFDCKASKTDIKDTLPDIRDAVQTPRELELSLMEDTENPHVSPLSDPALWIMVKEAREAGIRYSMEATYPNATNKKTADELSAILNQAYQSDLYPQGGKFKRWILYEDNGQYVERE